MAKVPTINHTVSLDYTVWPNVPYKQSCTYKAGHSKGLEATSQEPLINPFCTATSIDPFPPSAPGKIEFTWQEVVIGLESSLLMFPINLLIVQIF